MHVGIRQIDVRDDAMSSSFPAIVQYPVDHASTGTTIGPYDFDATRDAPPTAGRYPLCVISHGGGGSHLLYRSISTDLAAHGCVVICPEHPGDNRNDRSQSNTDLAALDRPRHLSLAIDAVLSDPLLGAIVDDARIAVIGHSMGGYTALALVGARPWSRAGAPIQTRGDPRMRAAVLLAPSTDWFLAPMSLARVSTPILILAAECDTITPPDRIRLAMASLPEGSACTFEVVAGAGHYSFITPFPPHMRRLEFAPSTDPVGFDRDALHRELPRRIRAFFSQSLGTP